jgi:transposase, IS5 family
MKPKVRLQDSGVEELFRAKLKNIINMRHELVRLGELIDWARLEAHFAPCYSAAGRPALPIRLVVGLHLLKYIEGCRMKGAASGGSATPTCNIFAVRNIFSTRFRWSDRG